MNKFKLSHGFTLIELLITLTIVGFILAAIYTFYLTGLKSWQRGADSMEAQQSARIAVNRIITELRYAHLLSLHGDNTEVRFKVSPDVRTRRFRLVGQELVYESYPPGTSNYFHNKIALGITGLVFELDSNNLLTITITAESESCQVTLTDSIRPRNLP